MGNAWKQLIGFSCSLPGSEVQVWGMRLCREDLEMLIETIRLAARNWPDREAMLLRWACRDCEWSGEEEDRIAVKGQGAVGCPRCGGTTAPLIPEFLRPEPSGQAAEGEGWVSRG